MLNSLILASPASVFPVPSPSRPRRCLARGSAGPVRFSFLVAALPWPRAGRLVMEWQKIVIYTVSSVRAMPRHWRGSFKCCGGSAVLNGLVELERSRALVLSPCCILPLLLPPPPLLLGGRPPPSLPAPPRRLFRVFHGFEKVSAGCGRPGCMLAEPSRAGKSPARLRRTV